MTAPEFTIPISVQDTEESIAGWPFRKPEPLESDEDAPDEYTDDWPDDHKLDSPTHVPYRNLGRR